jgi:ribonuclease VapC
VIVADTSALIAIAFGEAERARFMEILLDEDSVLISSVSVLEARMVAHGRRGPRALALIDDLLGLPVFLVISPGPAEMEAAFRAFLVYGKGSGHAAALNFGDLFAYALAKVRGVPLLFKDDDFAETDIVLAV